jgi:NADPH:quinone reductase-like Zn-dependent oxidoreductase
MAAAIPDTLPFAQAAVLPLGLSTAATGLFQTDHLGLALPGTDRAERGGTVLVWGGSTSVGSNAVQLAGNAGYRVVATASPHNFGYLRSLGADAVVDRRGRTAVAEILEHVGAGPLAGAVAIGAGSLRPCTAVAARAPGPGGSRRVAAAQAGPAVRLAARRARRRGVRVSGIWGGTLRDNEVGPAVYADFLPGALASGSYRAAPEAQVVGHGLERIPEALHLLRAGVSARKLVVTL